MLQDKKREREWVIGLVVLVEVLGLAAILNKVVVAGLYREVR